MRKSYIVLLLSSLLLALTSGAQRTPENLDSLKTFVVQPVNAPAQSGTLPFHNILVVDRRFDTSKAGYVKTGRSYQKLVTEMPFAATAQAFLNRKYGLSASTSSPTLLIVVKRFWLEQTSLAEQKNYKIAKTSSITSGFASCTAGFDVYVISGQSYIPVFAWDTACTENSPLKKCVDRLLFQPFDHCLAKIARMDFSKIDQAKRKLTWAEIEQYNNQRLAFPRFKNEIFTKGIYKSFQDFLRNKPLQQEFIIQYGSQTDEVFITENSKPALLTDYWGVCDGKKTYIKVGFNLFELIKQNNTYDLWGSKLTVDESYRYPASSNNTPTSAIIGSALLNNNRVENNYKPLQLNMETGMVY